MEIHFYRQPTETNMSARDEETQQPQQQEKTLAAQTTGSWTFTLLVFRTQILSVIDCDWPQEAWHGQCVDVLWHIREGQTHGEAYRPDSTAKRQPGDWQEPDISSDKKTSSITWGLIVFWCWIGGSLEHGDDLKNELDHTMQYMDEATFTAETEQQGWPTGKAEQSLRGGHIMRWKEDKF